MSEQYGFPLPWPDCDVHKVITLYGPLATSDIIKHTRLPRPLVHRVCGRLSRKKLIKWRRVQLEVPHLQGRYYEFDNHLVWSVAA